MTVRRRADTGHCIEASCALIAPAHSISSPPTSRAFSVCTSSHDLRVAAGTGPALVVCGKRAASHRTAVIPPASPRRSNPLPAAARACPVPELRVKELAKTGQERMEVDMKTQQMMEILGVVNRGEGKPGYWTRIGTAFLNRDGVSFTLRFNYLPADLSNTSIQLREPRPAKADEDGADPAVAS